MTTMVDTLEIRPALVITDTTSSRPFLKAVPAGGTASFPLALGSTPAHRGDGFCAPKG